MEFTSDNVNWRELFKESLRAGIFSDSKFTRTKIDFPETFTSLKSYGGNFFIFQNNHLTIPISVPAQEREELSKTKIWCVEINHPTPRFVASVDYINLFVKRNYCYTSDKNTKKFFS